MFLFTKKRPSNFKKGFTLVEAIVSIGVFAIMATAIFQVYIFIIKEVIVNREQTVIASLADQYLEIARNLPYSEIGTSEGNPSGNLPSLTAPKQVNLNGNTYNIYYAVGYVDDPADGTILAATDLSPNDYKQIKLYIINTSTNVTKKFLTNVAPSGLEGMSNAGALYIKIFNAVGQPISGATIHIVNTAVSPKIDVTRTSDSSGNWLEVSLPISANSYHITVRKSGYSADGTYAITEQNPNPVKPDATISLGQVTQISFSIDLLSNLTFYTENQLCTAVPNVDLGVKGSKLIGTSPNIPKFDNTYTSSADGQISLSNIEWDSYIPGLISSDLMVYGSSPPQQVNLLPNTSQNFTLILGSKTTNSLLVIVKDASTGNPIEGVNVDFKTSPENHNVKITGGSVWSQQDWSGGSGQINFVNINKYFADDGNISNNETPSGLRLLKFEESYVDAGYLISSTFDTGAISNSFINLTWQPISQGPNMEIKFQIAANNDSSTWNFTGPDGTSSTYYTVSGTAINSVNNNNRYVRYKIFLSTNDRDKTPVLTSINLNYVSGCFTPGQAMFPGLEADSWNKVVVSMDDYQTQTIDNINISGYNVLEVLLSH